MAICPVCNLKFCNNDFLALSEHFTGKAKDSDALHVMWLNRNITKTKADKNSLELLFRNLYDLNGAGIKSWIVNRFVSEYRGNNPHPFIIKMQDYNKYIMEGYAIEHYFFLKQWVRSCSAVISKTDNKDVQTYEMENMVTEYFGNGKKPHIELLLDMAEGFGISRKKIMETKPLKNTEKAISRWREIAQNNGWIEIMAAMHSLELIANSALRPYGARYDYFNLDAFDNNNVPETVKAFLMEGYHSDNAHSMGALNIIEKYSRDYNIENIQDAYLASTYVFYNYLEARIERGEMIENKQY